MVIDEEYPYHQQIDCNCCRSDHLQYHNLDDKNKSSGYFDKNELNLFLLEFPPTTNDGIGFNLLVQTDVPIEQKQLTRTIIKHTLLPNILD